MEDVKQGIRELMDGRYEKNTREISEVLKSENGCKAADILETYMNKRSSKKRI